MKRLLLLVFPLVLPGCPFASIPQSADALTRQLTAKGEVGFSMSKKLAEKETDPAVRAVLLGEVNAAEADFLMYSVNLLNAINSGVSPEEIAKWLALSEQFRKEAEAYKQLINTATSKPAK